jgi:IS4 transposase
MRRAAALYGSTTWEPDLPHPVYALDATMITLALNLFPWGYYCRTKQAALKLHMLLALKGNLPAWAVITGPKVGDLRMLDELPLQPGAYYVMDRGYMDFVRLYRLHQGGVFFVVRCKEPVSFSVREGRPVDKAKGYQCDQTVRLKSNWSEKSYPEPLRKIRLYDAENQVKIVLLTNNFFIPAEAVGQLYQRRWQVELFFKWIKQHLRLRAFYGRSENAVRSQIWSAICAYLLVAIFKKRHEIKKTMNEILQISSTCIFEQAPASEMLANENNLKHPAETHDESQKSLQL